MQKLTKCIPEIGRATTHTWSQAGAQQVFVTAESGTLIETWYQTADHTRALTVDE